MPSFVNAWLKMNQETGITVLLFEFEGGPGAPAFFRKAVACPAFIAKGRMHKYRK